MQSNVAILQLREKTAWTPGFESSPNPSLTGVVSGEKRQQEFGYTVLIVGQFCASTTGSRKLRGGAQKG
jgi:hypothetical protein